MNKAACIDDNRICFFFRVYDFMTISGKQSKHFFGICKIFIAAQ